MPADLDTLESKMMAPIPLKPIPGVKLPDPRKGKTTKKHVDLRLLEFTPGARRFLEQYKAAKVEKRKRKPRKPKQPKGNNRNAAEPNTDPEPYSPSNFRISSNEEPKNKSSQDTDEHQSDEKNVDVITFMNLQAKVKESYNK